MTPITEKVQAAKARLENKESVRAFGSSLDGTKDQGILAKLAELVRRNISIEVPANSQAEKKETTFREQ